MASSSSPPQKESIQILQTECHYLSLALNRLNEKNEPDEYNFLKQKLQAAEEKLHTAMSAAEAAVDDYSYDDNGPNPSNAVAYDSEIQAYYAATNSYRQQLQAQARTNGELLKGSKRVYQIDDDDDDGMSSSSGDSDDSSVGSAHRHVKRSYRKAILAEKSRDVFHKYQQKGKDYYRKGKENYQKGKEYYQEKGVKDGLKDVKKSSWISFILCATAFIILVATIAVMSKFVRRRRAYNENVGFNINEGSISATSSDPCSMLTISLKTDRFGNETSWDITRKDTVAPESPSDQIQYSETTIKSGGPYRYGKYTTIDTYTEQINEFICLPVGKYKFVLHDKLGDGVCCEYGRGQYGLWTNKREIRPMKDGIFLGKEEITNFEITLSDVGVVGEDDSSSVGETTTTLATTTASTTTTTTTTSTTTTITGATDKPSPGVNADGWSEKTDDWQDDIIDDNFDGGMGDDSHLNGEDDDLIGMSGSHSDDAVDPLMYYNVEEMDIDGDGKVSHDEFASGSEEISQHCSKINIQTSMGRSECERVCGEDHWCCFESTQNGYNCKDDPSFACETFKPCEILFVQYSSGGDSTEGSGVSKPTAQEMALIEENVHQYCSSGIAGVGLGKCQEICHDHLCCFETNFGVGNADCKSASQGLCTYYAGCEQLATSSSHWNSVNSMPNTSGNSRPNTSGLVMDNTPKPTDSIEAYEIPDVIPAALPVSKPLTLTEKLEVQDQIDQACSQNSIESGDGQCQTLCLSAMCCFDSSESGCANYDPMCPFYSSCEMIKYMNIGNRKMLRG